jgi:opacity protein-like surface antigen
MVKKIVHILLVSLLLLNSDEVFAQRQSLDDKDKRTPAYKSIPSSSFFTINAEYLSGYRPNRYFSAQVPAFGFKAGTMRNVGWYIGVMTNFNFKGAFVTCDESEINVGRTSSTYFDALAGITLRYWKPFSFHIGLGYSYRSFNNETIYGQWAHLSSHTAQGPAASAGFMLHLGSFVVSAEVIGTYNLQGVNDIRYRVDKTRFSLGLKAGLGLCIPYNYRGGDWKHSSLGIEGPSMTMPERRADAVPDSKVLLDTGVAQMRVAVQQPTSHDIFPKVVTLPVSQLSQGFVTVCGEVVEEGPEPVTERGVCWGTSQYPTITGEHTSDGEGIGYFTTVVSGMKPGKTYYIRAFAGTRSGVRYGNTVSVTLPDIPQMPAGGNQPPAPMLQQPVPPQQPVAPAVQQTVPPQQPVAPAVQQPVPPQQPVAPAVQQPVPPQQPVAPAVQQTVPPQQPVAPAVQQPVVPDVQQPVDSVPSPGVRE